ncbi:MAG: AAA family ATPase [Legionellaceae bacterium]|nr:AAA family ATPase [Legionellaceae bacterium]
MYQEFFNLTEFPFNQFPNTDYYYNLETHQKSLDVLKVGLQVNDGIIKITGQSGTGKSLLCRLFIENISKNYFPIYLHNPYFTYTELLQTILTELNVSYDMDDQNAYLSKLIYNKSLELKKKNKKLVLLFDEAQYLSIENLEIIQILSNFECANEKLCQIVLIGGLDLDDKLNGFNHVLQRISFSYTLLPINRQDLSNYIFHRLSKASKPHKAHDITFSPSAINLLYKKTKGIPRLINIVCHKSLMLAYSLDERHVSRAIVLKAILDTESITKGSRWYQFLALFTRKQDPVDLYSE